jgi:hypothetical protein
MSVAFYPQDQRYWNDPYPHLSIANANFAILGELLELSDEDGYIGAISTDALLIKIAKARTTLHMQGKEWERSEELPPAGQEDQSFNVLGTPGLDQERLHFYLDTIHQIALYAKERGTGVQWS